jgi:hypothetical protein
MTTKRRAKEEQARASCTAWSIGFKVLLVRARYMAAMRKRERETSYIYNIYI